MGAAIADPATNKPWNCTLVQIAKERKQIGMDSFTHIEADFVLDAARTPDKVLFREADVGPFHRVPIALGVCHGASPGRLLSGWRSPVTAGIRYSTIA